MIRVQSISPRCKFNNFSRATVPLKRKISNPKEELPDRLKKFDFGSSQKLVTFEPVSALERCLSHSLYNEMRDSALWFTRTVPQYFFWLVYAAWFAHLGHGVNGESEPMVELAVRMKTNQIMSEEAGGFP